MGPSEISDCPRVQALSLILASPSCSSSLYFSTGTSVSIVLSSHFHPDPSEAWHRVVCEHPDGGVSRCEERRERDCERGKRKERFGGWGGGGGGGRRERLAGRQRNLQSNPELCRIDQGAEVLLDTAIEGRGVWTTKKEEGWSKSNAQPLLWLLAQHSIRRSSGGSTGKWISLKSCLIHKSWPLGSQQGFSRSDQ